SRFTPSTIIDMSKERDWPASLGMLDWDNSSIVFTKRSLIEFLKYTGTTVDTNFSNISKLPRYAKFGKLSENSNGTAAEIAGSVATSTSTTEGSDFIPTRRVRTVPGGPQTDIFAPADEGDALSQAPPRADTGEDTAFVAAVAQETEENNESGINFPSSNTSLPGEKPFHMVKCFIIMLFCSRVRENPGGNSSLANFWDAAEPTDFKPTRGMVRQGPGGHDNINDVSHDDSVHFCDAYALV
ncbi:hypothetical protein BJ912DRAFT_862568, partial [Pholiota molesta]